MKIPTAALRLESLRFVHECEKCEWCTYNSCVYVYSYTGGRALLEIKVTKSEKFSNLKIEHIQFINEGDITIL